MRFRISTLLLAVLSISIAIGWLTDRSIQRNSEESIVDREGTSARIYFRSKEALDAIDRRTVKRDEDAKFALVSAIIDLCQNEELYNTSSYSFPYDAITRAGIILSRLECDTKESFRRYAVSLYPFMPENEQVAYREANNFLRSGMFDPQMKNTIQNFMTHSAMSMIA